MIQEERRGAVEILTIDRQDRRNAVDLPTLEELAAAIDRAADARVLILRGAGHHFCAGADLTGVEDSTFAVALRSVLDRLRDAPIPTMAAVEGAALGAGTQLAAACDLRVATRDARFGIPAARLGLMVDQWTISRLVALAGEGPGRAMLLAAEVLSGEDAKTSGLVQRIGNVDDAVRWAAEIAELAPLTVAGHKLALNQLEVRPPREAAFDEAFRRAWESADLREGIAAFRERRKPKFEGR